LARFEAEFVRQRPAFARLYLLSSAIGGLLSGIVSAYQDQRSGDHRSTRERPRRARVVHPAPTHADGAAGFHALTTAPNSGRFGSVARTKVQSPVVKGAAMRADDLILISVDDHLVEPPHMFEAHIPSAFADRAPRVITQADGSDVWTFEGSIIPNVGLNAVAGRPKEEYGIEPTAFDEMRPGCYDVHERIKDMSAAGVLGSMNFPSFPGFSGRLFSAIPDKDLALAVIRAYNDWHVDEWCGSYPDRFIPNPLPVLWDPQLAADEVRRMAKKGVHSVTFTENPATLGYPSYHSDHWDPFWRAVSDENVVVSVHLGSSGQLAITAADAPVDVMITLQPMNICAAAADILWSRVIKQFPAIRFALTEGGTGWIPYFMERLDRTYDMHRSWTGQDFGDRLPSEVFTEHFLTCFIADQVGVELRHKIGIDSVCWELDYPHSDSSWPTPAESLMAVAANVPDDELRKITHENAMRWYSFDPFTTRTRADSTVAALRAEVPGHDIEIRPFDKGRFVRTGKGIDLGLVAARATA
jgi:predicted TIM-barrel fold metal-dependent hydrolase